MKNLVNKSNHSWKRSIRFKKKSCDKNNLPPKQKSRENVTEQEGRRCRDKHLNLRSVCAPLMYLKILLK